MKHDIKRLNDELLQLSDLICDITANLNTNFLLADSILERAYDLNHVINRNYDKYKEKIND